MTRVKYAWPLSLILTLMISSCGDSPENEAGKTPAVEDKVVVASVNASQITTQEVEAARSRFNVGGAILDARFDDTLLQSLISSRAMAMLAEQELNDNDRQMLALKVAAYREELLVKSYLQRHATPAPVTQTMVKEYYDTHPEAFSGGGRKEFEYFTTTKEELTEEERKHVLAFLSAAKSKPNWEELLASEQKIPMNYRKVKARISVLKNPLKTLVESTPVGSVSSVHVGKQLAIVRVLDEEVISARPLAEVSGEIRKRLAPMQLRKAVKELSKQALQQVKVTYPNSNN